MGPLPLLLQPVGGGGLLLLQMGGDVPAAPDAPEGGGDVPAAPVAPTGAPAAACTQTGSCMGRLPFGDFFFLYTFI